MTEADSQQTQSGDAGPPLLQVIIRRIDRFTDWTGWLIAFLVVPLIITVVSEVVGRYMLGGSLFWSYDVTYMLYGTLFMLGAAYTLLHKGHIRSDFLYVNMPVRVQGFIDTVAYLGFFFPAMVFLFWFGWVNFQDAVRLGESSINSAWRPSLVPFRAVIPLTAVLLMIQGVSEALKSIHAMTTGRWL